MECVSNDLVEIHQHSGTGYKALVYFESWRVAFLNYDEKFMRENTIYLERHDLTDEVFILLSGTCSLFIGNGDSDSPGQIKLLPLETQKMYNVKKGVWHNLVLTPGTSLLIVENSNTSKDNSLFAPVTLDQLPVSE